MTNIRQYSRRRGTFTPNPKGVRSRFEQKIKDFLELTATPFTYEEVVLPYQKPMSRYITDFVLGNGIIVETKGWFLPEDRTKHLLLKKLYPQLDIRFVFKNAKNTLSPSSKTTYAQWCEKNGFKWAQDTIPHEWLEEKVNEEVLRYLQQFNRKKAK